MTNQQTSASLTRRLGRTDLEPSAIGLGCWAIGGPFTMFGQTDGWGEVDDEESVRAIRRALDLGVTFFDTADAYGTGHSERVLGRALGADRERVVVATKFGYTYDEERRDLMGTDTSAAYIRRACEASLRRLGTDHIDLYQLHVGDLPVSEALTVMETLEDLVAAGTIRAYGWSTDDAERAEFFAAGAHCAAVQHELNLFRPATDLLATCARHDLSSVNRTPLAMGLLTGKFGVGSRLPADDVRSVATLPWFDGGRPSPALLAKLDGVREILRSGGRTPAQGALAWIWGTGDRTIPIPGFRTVAQVEDNAGALAHGPLSPEQVAEVNALLRDPDEAA
ncbi:Predicted oxidoreductase [Actinopolymorpha cephalotaxi]|uniref:Predicted oxidoreductase n=1 Tax=Actinopolymorpha cephalotaxi TaxID=504797 RepID=A0A1I2URD2_9ACTN|nr:aldo/keto reductase [Actinopolymorpha cephalotaxi]NYH86674.1 aryl-alcohol dehydrogenase-like predicted oxidoreductase [Actinopolymorpha cephalotaxi]SFG78819.1 Predicted oxidoreductase [Actinopolymorpha cephalotaxi]